MSNSEENKEGSVPDQDTQRQAELLSLFKNISDKANHGEAITDMQGNLMYVNAYFARIHGYEPEELIGRNLSLFHTAEQMQQVGHLLNELHEKGQTGPDEVWHVHRNGTTFPMLMSNITIAGSHGEPLYLATSAIDISNLKKT